jgi:hypothetical protein
MSALVSGLLAKKPKDRHGSAAEVAEDLRRLRYGLLPLGFGPAESGKGVASRSSVQATTPIPLAAVANEGKKWTKASWVLIAAFALFALLGGSAWSLLNGSQGHDLAPTQEDSQAFAPVFAPEDEAGEAPEEAEQAPIVEIAPAKDTTLGGAHSNAATEGTNLEQISPSNTTVESSGFNPPPVNSTTSFAPQSAPTQQEAQAQQVASGQQAQAKSNSSQTSYAGESEAQKVSGAQKGQAVEQIFESSESSDKQ